MEIPERDFLRAGYFWMVAGLLAALPWIGPSWIGELARWVIVVAALVHVGEALYSQTLAARVGADPNLWWRRSLFMGFLALRVLQRAQPPAPPTGAPPTP